MRAPPRAPCLRAAALCLSNHTGHVNTSVHTDHTLAGVNADDTLVGVRVQVERAVRGLVASDEEAEAKQALQGESKPEETKEGRTSPTSQQQQQQPAPLKPAPLQALASQGGGEVEAAEAVEAAGGPWRDLRVEKGKVLVLTSLPLACARPQLFVLRQQACIHGVSRLRLPWCIASAKLSSRHVGVRTH